MCVCVCLCVGNVCLCMHIYVWGEKSVWLARVWMDGKATRWEEQGDMIGPGKKNNVHTQQYFPISLSLPPFTLPYKLHSYIRFILHFNLFSFLSVFLPTFFSSLFPSFLFSIPTFLSVFHASFLQNFHSFLSSNFFSFFLAAFLPTFLPMWLYHMLSYFRSCFFLPLWDKKLPIINFSINNRYYIERCTVFVVKICIKYIRLLEMLCYNKCFWSMQLVLLIVSPSFWCIEIAQFDHAVLNAV